MPQPIGNNTYQIYARNSAGVYSNPISVTVNVQECGGISSRLVISTDATLRVLTETGATIFQNIVVAGVNQFRSIIKTNDPNKVAVFGTDFSLANPKISLLNPSTGEITGIYSPASGFSNLALGSDNNLYFSTNTTLEKLSITANAPTRIASINVAQSNFASTGTLVSAGTKLYRFVNGNIEIIDIATFTLLETVTIPSTVSVRAVVAKNDGSLIYFVGGATNSLHSFNTTTKSITPIGSTSVGALELFLDTTEANIIAPVSTTSSSVVSINVTTGTVTNIIVLPSQGGFEYRKSNNSIYFAPIATPGILTKRDLTTGTNTQLLNAGQALIFNILAI